MRCLALVAFFAICSLGFAQMPTGFPTMPNTGNPAADAQSYEQAKTQWLQLNGVQPVRTSVITEPTEQQNAAYEAQKTLVTGGPTEAPSFAVDPAALAERRLNELHATFESNQEEMASSNARLHQAYLDLFAMTRGQSVVTLTQAEHANMYTELRDLVNANPTLFNITQ